MINYLFILISASVYFVVGYFIPRHDFTTLLLLYSVVFFIYVYWLFTVRDKKMLNIIIWASVFFRLIFIISEPNLSDDIYRFLWDGKKIIEKQSPYSHTPAQTPKFDSQLYPQLNSQHYFSVYPPVNQLFFAISGFFYHHFSLKAGIAALHVIVFLFEILLLLLIAKMLSLMKLASWKMLIYAANPLVIIELSGNLHFEGVMMFFAIAALYYLFKHNSLLAGSLFGVAIGIKLLAALMLPYLFLQLKNKSILFLIGLVFSIVVVFGWFFIYPNEWFNFLQSIDLYFHSFEFNAGIYYLIRETGFSILGYNPIKIVGSVLPIITLLIILIIYIYYSLKENQDVFSFDAILLAFIIYYLMATTVHPWYLVNVIILSVFSRHYLTAIAWSGVVFLSYSAYQQPEVKEVPILIVLEYLAVSTAFVFDFIVNKKKYPVIATRA